MAKTDSEKLNRSMQAFDPGLGEGAIIRFLVDIPWGDDVRTYTYAALWVNGQWYTTTAYDGGPIPKKLNHSSFMACLVENKAYNIELATEFDLVRP